MLDFLDGLDEIDPYEDEERFTPFFQRGWVKVLAIVLAVAMSVLACYSGLRLIFGLP